MQKIEYVFLNIHISKTACAQFRTEHLDSAFLYYLLGLQFSDCIDIDIVLIFTVVT